MKTAKRMRLGYEERMPNAANAIKWARDEYAKHMDERAKYARDHAEDHGGETLAGIHYDLEVAATVTGRSQLLRVGIVPVPPQELNRDEDLHDELWTVIEGLAMCGIYLVNTNHLSDSDLYARLYFRILEEPTRVIPADICAECIDCLHPLDRVHPRGEALSSSAVGPNDQEQPSWPPPIGRGPIVHAFSSPTELADRDRHLPIFVAGGSQ